MHTLSGSSISGKSSPTQDALSFFQSPGKKNGTPSGIWLLDSSEEIACLRSPKQNRRWWQTRIPRLSRVRIDSPFSFGELYHHCFVPHTCRDIPGLLLHAHDHADLRTVVVEGRNYGTGHKVIFHAYGALWSLSHFLEAIAALGTCEQGSQRCVNA